MGARRSWLEAEDRRLVRVEVLSGRATIRRSEHAPIALGAGEHWSRKVRVEPTEPAKPKWAATPTPRPKKAPRRATTPPPKPEAKVRTADHPSEVAFREGWAALGAQDYPTAAEAFTVAAEPGSPVRQDAAYWRAVAWMRASQAAEAERAFRSYLETFPDADRADEAALLLGRLLRSAETSTAPSRGSNARGPSRNAKVKARAERLLR